LIASHLFPINVRALVLLNDYYLQLAFADSQNASEQDDTQNEITETAEVSHETTSTIEESDSSELLEKSFTKASEEEQEKVKEKKLLEEVKEKEREEIKEIGTRETPNCEETQKEETSASGWCALRSTYQI